MSNRGRSWKSSRWGGKWGKRQGGGVTSSWRTNYRGWMSKKGNSGWGSSLGRMGSRLGGGDWGSGRIRSSLSGSMDPGVGLSSLGQGDAQRQSGTGGILSNFEPSWGGGKDKAVRPRFSAISGDLEADVRERYEQQVTALIFRYAQVFYGATGDDLRPVIDNLTDMLGQKYARLALDWVHEKGKAPGVDDVSGFVIWIVEAAAVDGGREPLSWKIQRAISAMLDQLFGGGRGEQEEREIQSQGQMGAEPAQA